MILSAIRGQGRRELPTGAEMTLIAWHESASPQRLLLPERGGKREGMPLPQLKDGEVREFNISNDESG